MDVDEDGMLMQRSIHSIKIHEFVRFIHDADLFFSRQFLLIRLSRSSK